jgi:LAT3 family solute carrier family 43 protein 3
METQPLITQQGGSSSSYCSSPISISFRFLTNIIALTSVFFFSGIIFGWAPLELMLLEEGQYSELCISPTSTANSTTTCPDQINKLNAMFTMAQFWLSFASLPVGFLLDYAPKTLHFAICGILEVTGLVLFAHSSSSSSSDYFVLAYSLLALGGCMTMLGAFPASFLLPTYQAGILASISCLFDASSIVFYAFYKLSTSLHIIAIGMTMTRQSLFLTWAAMAVMVYTALVACWYQLERQDWKQVLQEEQAAKAQHTTNGKPSSPSSSPMEEVVDLPVQPQRLNHHQRRLLELPLQSVRQQLATPEFGLVVLFASIHMLRCNFYIMTVDDFLKSLGDVDAIFANMFSWILPSGIIFVPLIEATLTKLGVVRSLYLTNGIGLLFGIVLLISLSLRVQAINFGMFTAFRA